MKIISMFGVDRYLEYCRGWHRELFEFENYKLLDATDENGVTRYIVAKNSGNKTVYYQLSYKDFYELIVLYLGGRKELFLTHRLLEELSEVS